MPLSREAFNAMALEKTTRGDLFAHPHPVITVKAGGRPYGKLSQQALERGVKLPVLSLGDATYQAPYIFVALWDDASEYTHAHLLRCATAILRAACDAGLETFAMPVIGGKQAGQLRPVMEAALFEAGDCLDQAGIPFPEHVYITK